MMKTLKKIMLLFIIVSTLSGCAVNNSSNQSESDNSDNPYEYNDNGYKPVIFYEDKLYWLDVEQPPKTLPDNLIELGKSTMTSDSTNMTLPSKNLECNFYENSTVYIDETKNYIYLVTTDGYISKMIIE